MNDNLDTDLIVLAQDTSKPFKVKIPKRSECLNSSITKRFSAVIYTYGPKKDKGVYTNNINILDSLSYQTHQ